MLPGEGQHVCPEGLKQQGVGLPPLAADTGIGSQREKHLRGEGPIVAYQKRPAVVYPHFATKENRAVG